MAVKEAKLYVFKDKFAKFKMLEDESVPKMSISSISM